ncbi:MAG: hypothetical protein ACFB22_07730 [Rhodothalassiaceae bacterium]
MTDEAKRTSRRNFLRLSAGAASASVVPVRSVLGQTVAGSMMCEVQVMDAPELSTANAYDFNFALPVADKYIVDQGVNDPDVIEAFGTFMANPVSDWQQVLPRRHYFSTPLSNGEEKPSPAQRRALRKLIEAFQEDYAQLQPGGSIMVGHDGFDSYTASYHGPLDLKYLETIKNSSNKVGVGHSCLHSMGLPLT